MQLEKTFTDSKTVSGIRYNPETKVLSITYVTGKTYDYADVPERVVDHAMNAESIGKFVNTYIKEEYKYKLVN
ncbi:MAG TPA: KTSC domain-containing protein [Cyclobacteriaceae bacterium]|jgi:hypothetical protein|nr:KTSC domain-containing protein [Cyclobacteriaceae bacterium]